MRAFLLCLLLILPRAAHAADEPVGGGAMDTAVIEDVEAGFSGVREAFNTAAARRPRPGEWLEYRIAIPVDPLENSLRPNPAPSAGMGDTSGGEGTVAGEGVVGDAVAYGEGEEVYIRPTFEPDTAWRVIPVRLVIREVYDAGCQAVFRYPGGSEEIYLGGPWTEAEAEFQYDTSTTSANARRVMLGGDEIAVDVARREGTSYGFERWSNADLPFGLFRFATPHMDIILVGMGMADMAPEFPTRVANRIDPPLGLLYK